MSSTNSATLSNLRELFYDVLREISDLKVKLVQLECKVDELQRRSVLQSHEAVAYSSQQLAPKYRDPVSGKTWSGHGVRPKWMRGRSARDFQIS